MSFLEIEAQPRLLIIVQKNCGAALEMGFAMQLGRSILGHLTLHEYLLLHSLNKPGACIHIIYHVAMRSVASRVGRRYLFFDVVGQPVQLFV
jgi:hypothetical protein